MSRPLLDVLPTEIILLVVDNLEDLTDLQSLLHAIGWLPELLTSQQIAATKDEEQNTILHLLTENREADLIDSLLSKDKSQGTD
jgi:Flagellar regulatory protein FleQ